MEALKIQNLVKKYWDFEVLKWIDTCIEDWDFFSLLWVNWAWKTTIIGIITDLVKKTSWKVSVFWVDIDEDINKAKSMIWVVPQEFNMDFFVPVIDVVVTQAWYYWIPRKEAISRAEKILKELDLYDKKDTPIRSLSWGMKRRVMIARALVHEPKLLILDEPTAWVDINLRKSMWEYLVSLNKKWTTILLTTHYLEEVEALCNRIAVINKWEILMQWTKDEIFSHFEDNKFEITLWQKLDSFDDLNAFSPKINWDKLEITLPKKNKLNDIFDILSKSWIEIKNVENKTNELEEIFANLSK